MDFEILAQTFEQLHCGGGIPLLLPINPTTKTRRECPFTILTYV